MALKVVPQLFTLDSDRLARFTREAHLLAALNHPNAISRYRRGAQLADSVAREHAVT